MTKYIVTYVTEKYSQIEIEADDEELAEDDAIEILNDFYGPLNEPYRIHNVEPIAKKGRT